MTSTSIRSLTSAAALALLALSACKNEPKSGRYCNEKTPDNCIIITFDKDMLAEVKIMAGKEVLYEGKDSYHLGSIKLNPTEGVYAGKPLQLAFAHDDPSRFDFEVYGKFPHEVYRRK